MPSLSPTRRSSKLPTLLLAVVSLAGFGILVRVRSFSSSSSSSSSSKPPVSVISMTTSSSSSSSAGSLPVRWRPLGPSSFSSGVVSPDDGRRYAKDEGYLRAVLESWNLDDDLGVTEEEASPPSPRGVETTPWIYHDDRGTPLYGHLVRPIAAGSEKTTDDENDDDDDESAARTTTPPPGGDHRRLPGILLFHTAAGPQDVFLFRKAAELASSSVPGGCVVLIADVFSDRDGWAWNADDRTRYDRVREELFRDEAAVLRSRVAAAVRVLAAAGSGAGSDGDGDDDDNEDGLRLGVDPDRLAALGWCFGAHPLLELAILQDMRDRGTVDDDDVPAFSASALVSYHGVYRRDDPPVVPAAGAASRRRNREVLICTGGSDPFVAPEDLELAGNVLKDRGYDVRILELDGAKHGFTNRAQDLNPNPAFGYDEAAATTSWMATAELLQRKLLL